MAKPVRRNHTNKELPENLRSYKKYVPPPPELLKPVLAAAAVGDFSKDIKISEIRDEFTDLQVGIQLMIDFIREQTEELTGLNVQLAELLQRRTDSLQRQRAIFRSIGDGLVVTDLEARVRHCNQATEQILHLKQREIIGQKWHELVKLVDEGGKPVNLNYGPLEKSIRTGRKVATRKYQYKLRSGKIIPVSLTATPVKVGNKAVGAVKVFHDISQEKAIERAKSDFVALASHQMRTPLSITKWYSQLLEQTKTELSPRQTRYLKEIKDSNLRMINLVNSLLSASQIESGTLAVDLKTVDLEKLIEKLCDELTDQFRLRNLKLSKKFATESKRVKLDPELIKIALHNLISNAAKYTPRGGKVDISLRVYDAKSRIGGQKLSQDSLVLAVVDSGRGIPRKEHGKIFDRFYQASNIKNLGLEGSGLGLYISKYVIDKSGGQIWFQSAVNKGSKFYVAIPAS